MVLKERCRSDLTVVRVSERNSGWKNMLTWLVKGKYDVIERMIEKSSCLTRS